MGARDFLLLIYQTRHQHLEEFLQLLFPALRQDGQRSCRATAREPRTACMLHKSDPFCALHGGICSARKGGSIQPLHVDATSGSGAHDEPLLYAPSPPPPVSETETVFVFLCVFMYTVCQCVSSFHSTGGGGFLRSLGSCQCFPTVTPFFSTVNPFFSSRKSIVFITCSTHRVFWCI